MYTTKCCAFIDVLGYGALVKDTTITIDKKIRILNSIYSSIAVHISTIINEINEKVVDKIFIRSFSDCFYMECDRVEPIIVATSRIFNWTFGFYANFSANEERTPLLRGGIVRDWTVRFKDIGGITNNTSELNPVGLGVARAYWTSEHSSLSGMRIIISPEVFNELKTKEITGKPFVYYGLEISEDSIPFPYYFKHISVNEENKTTDLYELIWSYTGMDDCTFDYIDELEKLRGTFNEKSKRHFVETAKVLHAGLLLTDCAHRTTNIFVDQKKRLEDMIAS